MKTGRSVSSLVESGQDGLVVTIECSLSNNLPNIVIVGYANRAVDEAKERIRSSFGSSKLNADMTNRDIKASARLEAEAKAMLDQAADKFGLSARAYMRSVKVARTIADLDSSEVIGPRHIAEALQYRPHAYHGQ